MARNVHYVAGALKVHTSILPKLPAWHLETAIINSLTISGFQVHDMVNTVVDPANQHASNSHSSSSLLSPSNFAYYKRRSGAYLLGMLALMLIVHVSGPTVTAAPSHSRGWINCMSYVHRQSSYLIFGAYSKQRFYPHHDCESWKYDFQALSWGYMHLRKCVAADCCVLPLSSWVTSKLVVLALKLNLKINSKAPKSIPILIPFCGQICGCKLVVVCLNLANALEL